MYFGSIAWKRERKLHYKMKSSNSIGESLKIATAYRSVSMGQVSNPHLATRAHNLYWYRPGNFELVEIRSVETWHEMVLTINQSDRILFNCIIAIFCYSAAWNRVSPLTMCKALLCHTHYLLKYHFCMSDRLESRGKTKLSLGTFDGTMR